MENKRGLGQDPQGAEKRILALTETAVRNVVDAFGKNIEGFKSGNLRQDDLYAGDFRPMPGTTDAKSNAPLHLQVVLPGEIFLTADHGELYREFIRTLTKDKDIHSLDITKGEEIPQDKTHNLKVFIKSNPGQQLGFTCMILTLDVGLEEQMSVEIKRYYLDSNTMLLRPLAEIWTARRHRKY